MTDQLVITTTADGRTTLEPDAPATMDERDPQPVQPHLFNAPASIAGQLSLGGIE